MASGTDQVPELFPGHLQSEKAAFRSTFADGDRIQKFCRVFSRSLLPSMERMFLQQKIECKTTDSTTFQPWNPPVTCNN